MPEYRDTPNIPPNVPKIMNNHGKLAEVLSDLRTLTGIVPVDEVALMIACEPLLAVAVGAIMGYLQEAVNHSKDFDPAHIQAIQDGADKMIAEARAKVAREKGAH